MWVTQPDGVMCPMEVDESVNQASPSTAAPAATRGPPVERDRRKPPSLSTSATPASDPRPPASKTPPARPGAAPTRRKLSGSSARAVPAAAGAELVTRAAAASAASVESGRMARIGLLEAVASGSLQERAARDRPLPHTGSGRAGGGVLKRGGRGGRRPPGRGG